MRRRQIFAASSAAVALATVTALVAAGLSRTPTEPSEPMREALPVETTTTTLDLEVAPAEINALVLSATETALTEQANAQSTTTTTIPPTTTTTTTPPQAPAPQPKPGPTTTTTTAPPSPTTTAPPSGGFNSGYEADFRGRINSLRASNGLSALSNDGSLTSYARSWAKTLAERGKLDHSNISSLIPPWSAAGENVGLGGSVSSIFSSLAASGGHLENMLADWTHMGVGVYVDGDGVIWTAHVFTR